MNLHRHKSYLLEQHSESFKIWSANIRINTEGKSLIMKLGPVLRYGSFNLCYTNNNKTAMSNNSAVNISIKMDTSDNTKQNPTSLSRQ